MTQSKINITTLLEQYVFEVAAGFIDEASPEDQTRLINLFNSIEKSPRINNRSL